MRRIFWALAVLALLGNAAAADENDLSGGVLIAHAPPGYTYTMSLDACGDWETTYSISDCNDVVARIDTDPGDPEASSVWYLIAAWDESKTMGGFEFGFGDYDDESVYYFYDAGVCAPDGLSFQRIFYDEPNWPGPNNGLAVAGQSQTEGWTGSWQALYWFAGVAVGEGTIPIDTNPQTELVDGPAFLPLDGGQYVLPVEARGVLGIDTDGVIPCPGTDTGACCLFGGECIVTTEIECTGDFQGVGTTCDPNPCDIVWACCVGETCLMVSESECTSLEGTWHVDQVCEEDGGDWTCPPDDLENPTWGSIKASYR